MALSIKDEATDQLVRRYAALRKTSFTDAIRVAVTEALNRESGPDDEAEWWRRLREIQDEIAAAPRSSLTDDEILGYDEHGLPN